MILFVGTAGAMVCMALAFLIAPLVRRPRHDGSSMQEPQDRLIEIYRNQMSEIDGDVSTGSLAGERHQEARQELEWRMLAELAPERLAPAVQGRSSAATAIGLLILMPLLTGALYWKLGTPGALDARIQADHGSGAHSTSPDQIGMMVDGLAKKLAANPDDADGWGMLARSLVVLGRYGEALDAFRKATEHSADDAALLADYADAVAVTQQGRLAGKPMQLVRRALKADPANSKALALAGTEAFDRRDYRGAATFWEKALKAAPEGTEFTTALHASLEEARSLAGDRSRPVKATPELTQAVTAQISGRVTLSASLRGKVPPGGTLFVFARAESGPRMPLAILRTNVKALPMEFTLDDSSAMSPALKLSNFDRVIVSARISKSGDALPSSGDLIGSSGPVSVGTRNLQIEISEIVK